MDGTLIETISGKTYAVDGKDWKFWSDATTVAAKVRELHKDGYRIVVFTN